MVTKKPQLIEQKLIINNKQIMKKKLKLDVGYTVATPYLICLTKPLEITGRPPSYMGTTRTDQENH